MWTTTGLVTTATVACLFLGPRLSAQERVGQTPTFRGGTELVTVDVGVVDKQGFPVRGLAASDFAVTVEGQPRRVVTAEFVDVSAANPEVWPSPNVAPISTNQGGGAGRQFVFIVDQSTLEPGSGHRVAAAASSFFAQLSLDDRSALMVLPAGTGVPFTWVHQQVHDALEQVTGLSSQMLTWDRGSLAEARDITNNNENALRIVGDRECGGPSISASNGSSGSTSGGSAGGNTSSTGRTGAAAGGGATTGGGSSSSNALRGTIFGLDSCRREVRAQAEMAWRSAQIAVMSSVGALRDVLAALGHVRGDKTVILISGGWPLDDREVHSQMAAVAAEANAARATLYTLFIPASDWSASQRMATFSTSSSDRQLQASPLEILADLTGGAAYRVAVGAEGVFERIGRELEGYYRIGVERIAPDSDGKSRRMKVQVLNGGATVRARATFDARTFEDRDWTARLNSALESPTPATGVGLRVTSYLAAGAEAAAPLSIMLAGEASRLQPGGATFRMLVRDLEGKRILSTEQPLTDVTTDAVPFTVAIPVPRGRYIVRVAVMDSAGHVGSVDHRVDAQQVALGTVSASGPLLVRVPGAEAAPRLALDSVGQDERLAIQLDLEGERAVAGAGVTFEIAASADGQALLHTDATLARGPRTGTVLAQSVADMRVLPPGSDVARARVTSGSEPLGEVHRAFSVIAAPRVAPETANALSVVGRAARATPVARVPSADLRPFALAEVLAPQVVGEFIDRVAARSDAGAPATRDLLARARTSELGQLNVSDADAAAKPVAAFVKGLSLLAQHRVAPAANEFRSAMRASPDFYPAMVYLGVCYAAGGNDKDAAGAWRTALIKEADALPVHVLLTDALLRQGRADLAFDAIARAHARWPEDEGLTRRFVATALLAGKYADGLQAIDQLIERRAEDEASLASALRVLYDGFVSGRPIVSIDADRTRMIRLAGAYRARGGPSLALVDAWVAAVDRKD